MRKIGHITRAAISLAFIGSCEKTGISKEVYVHSLRLAFATHMLEDGAHIDTCDECGFEKISYNSCRNRHYPKCQTLAKEQWVEKQNQYLLNTGYFHVVFTMPDELNAVMLQNQRKAYCLFFKSVSETLLELCADKKYRCLL